MSVQHSFHWSDGVRECESRGLPYVIATLLGARGSTPRDSGTKMLITIDSCSGSLGGGQLEHAVQAKARQLLAEGRDTQRLENFPLGERLGQCCGGSTSVLLECFHPSRLPIYLFGAGHVGRALVPLLAGLPVTVLWIDSRGEEFPAPLPAGITKILTDTPRDVITEAVPGAAYVIMTHQHPLDYELLEAVLDRGDASYLGVIGSASKWRRFEMRLAHRGYAQRSIDQVRCPIGLVEVPGKHPAEIAVSVAGELIAHYHGLKTVEEPQAGPGWKALRASLDASGAADDLIEDQNP